MAKKPIQKLEPCPHNATLIIPGLGGSVLYAHNKKTGENKLLWPNIINSKQKMLKYGVGKINPETWQYESQNDEYEVFASQSNYGLWAQDYYVYKLPLHDLVQLLKDNGYVPGLNLFGFSYDWRQFFATPQFQSQLLNRIKEAYVKSGFRKIDVITHSLGGIVFRIFCILNPEAVRAFVRRFIAIACPFNGSAHSLESLIFGYGLGVPKIIADPKAFQMITLTNPCQFWFLANSQFPFSPKLGIKYHSNEQMRWFGFHLDEDGKCWDYDSLNILNTQRKDLQGDKVKKNDLIENEINNEQNIIIENDRKEDDEEDDEDQLLEGIDSGQIKINKFILEKTIFSREALNRFRLRREKEKQNNLKDEQNQKQNIIDVEYEIEKNQLLFCQCECGSSKITDSSYLQSQSQQSSQTQTNSTNIILPQSDSSINQYSQQIQHSSTKLKQFISKYDRFSPSFLANRSNPYFSPCFPPENEEDKKILNEFIQRKKLKMEKLNEEQINEKQLQINQIKQSLNIQTDIDQQNPFYGSIASISYPFAQSISNHSSNPQEIFQQLNQRSNNNKIKVLQQLKYLIHPQFNPYFLNIYFRPGFPLPGCDQRLNINEIMNNEKQSYNELDNNHQFNNIRLLPYQTLTDQQFEMMQKAEHQKNSIWKMKRTQKQLIADQLINDESQQQTIKSSNNSFSSSQTESISNNNSNSDLNQYFIQGASTIKNYNLFDSRLFRPNHEQEDLFIFLRERHGMDSIEELKTNYEQEKEQQQQLNKMKQQKRNKDKKSKKRKQQKQIQTQNNKEEKIKENKVNNNEKSEDQQKQYNKQIENNNENQQNKFKNNEQNIGIHQYSQNDKNQDSNQIDINAPFKGKLLWSNPSLEDLRKRTEEIQNSEIKFPPPDQFEFINIYGTGHATVFNLIVVDGCMNGLNNKQTHIENPWDVTSDHLLQPFYSVIDGDGLVPSISAANDGMDAAARFEIRDVEHTEILFKPSVLLLISCIMGLKVLPNVQ